MNAASTSTSVSHLSFRPSTETGGRTSRRTAAPLDVSLSVLGIVALLLLTSGAFALSYAAGSGAASLPSSGASPAQGLAPNPRVAPMIPHGTGSQYPVNFTETGLPHFTGWTVDIAGVISSSNQSSIVVSLANGSWFWTVSGGSGYTATPSMGNVTVAGGGASVVVSFATSVATNYPIWFTETGLANSTNWAIALGSQNSSSVSHTITFSVTNGTYPFFVVALSGMYPEPPVGNVTVAGMGQHVPIQFSANPTYPVRFSENGTNLTSGTNWVVNVTGPNGSWSVNTTGTSLVYHLTNGTYNYSIWVPGTSFQTAVPENGTFTVAGAFQTVSVTFGPAPPIYTIQFTETGLPSIDVWCVSLGGRGTCGSSNLVVGEPNGTYAYVITAPPGYVAAQPYGNLTISGAARTVTVTWALAPGTYGVTFTEIGLPSGTVWSVTLGPNGVSTNGTNATFFVANGTFVFSVPAVAGYSENGGNGWLNVSGASFGVLVLFTAGVTTYPVTIGETGLANGTQWQVNTSGASSSGSLTLNTVNSTVISLSNGSYTFTVVPVAGYTATYNSSVVIQGAGATFSVVFGTNSNSTPPPPAYSVTLTESGLPNGTGWSASLGGSGWSSTTRTITFAEPNGTYPLTVSPPANYTANFTSPVRINGGPVSVSVAFSGTAYPITFLETGLPEASDWTVSATDAATPQVVSGTSTQATLTLHLTDGTYTLTASGPLGYRISLSASVISVSGNSPATVTAAFTPTPSGVGASETPPLIVSGILVVTALVAIVGAGWGYARYQYTQRRTKALGWVQEFHNDVVELENRPPR
jgi:hypothetical protein